MVSFAGKAGAENIASARTEISMKTKRTAQGSAPKAAAAPASVAIGPLVRPEVDKTILIAAAAA